MALGGVLGNGMKVGYSLASPMSWVRIGQLMDIPDFPQLISDEVDTMVHGTSRIKTTMPGMIEPPEVSLDMLADFDPATMPSQEVLRTLQRDGTTVYWRIEAPVNRAQTSFRSWEFSAWVKEWSPSVPIEDKQTLHCVLKFDGPSVTVNNVGASVIT